ncbi:MAG TPA: acyloxyacyl hydrolase [Terriglobales bacterium]|jgi:hypothetical protein|nr:acyloxyacyl hydrolase [Terriglobales bacterium]
MKVVAAVLLLCGLTWGQRTESLGKGVWEFGIWTGGATSVSSTAGVRLWNLGMRAGKVLTDEHGPGPLRGRLEYAADLVPLYIIWHSKTSYAAAINPLILKWNFSGTARVVPYFELGGGLLVSPDELPAGTSNVNFLPQGSFGVYVFTREKRAVSLAARYVHISNAGISDPNPGINTLQFSVGYHWFK